MRDTIVETALNFVGQQEIRGNMGFKDEAFEDLMEAVGWQKTQAWCAYFVELVWKLAYANDPQQVRELGMIMSGGAVATYNGFKKAGYEINYTGRPGDIIIWQKHKEGKPHWSGHAGIVVQSSGSSFDTVEGNTNDDGSREGYEVARRTRTYEKKFTGLNIKGFISPPEITEI